ncbi:MAG TPA: UDP-N-acetylmuramoyl-tripeptide--D-alanyl-D-alanine ligase [Acidimicrobiales bacterium]|nr:UDP-N-acetylmuramoyl-tripeptide--D-alanyl-D-alanine ligase [Acidimicrobiales bacterium]
MHLRTADIAGATGGTLAGPDVTVAGLDFDSRTLPPGFLFVPVVAERDGHDFIASAVERGAAAYLSARGSVPEAGEATCIEVADTAAALSDIGRMARRRLPERVVAVTGSVGKSSVKDLTSSVLSARWVTASSPGNFNNELGLPVTLANAPDGAEAAMLEMGARGIGHIAALCEVARPTVGIVTLVAAVHTEVFGSIEDVARGKGELVESLPEHGTAVLNAADPRVMAMASRTRARCLTFSGSGAGSRPADVVAEDIELDEQLRPRFKLVSPWGPAAVNLQARGEHSVGNALAAAAAGLSLGLTPDEVAAGLGAAPLSHWRMELATAPGGAQVLNDAYNASPTSMEAALRSARRLEGRRHFAVLGVMAELGFERAAEHRRIGQLATSLGFHVIPVDTAEYGPAPVKGWEAALDALGALSPALGAGDVLLVKGSRVAGLERLADALLTQD